MDVYNALAHLGERLEDLKGDKYNNTVKLKYLGYAEVQLANMLHDAYLGELETLEESVSVAGGKTALSVLGYDILRSGQGIKEVKIHGGKICIPIDFKDRKATEHPHHHGSADDPYYWVYGGYIYVLPASTALIDVSYLRIPSPLLGELTVVEQETPDTEYFLGTEGEGLSAVDDTYAGAVIYSKTNDTYHVVLAYTGATRLFYTTVAPGADPPTWDSGDKFYFLTHDFSLLNIEGTQFTLNESHHEIILLLAEGACWAQSNETSRRDSAIGKALQMLEILNAKYEAPEGVGTKSLRQTVGR